jgi:hypothetical protein
MCTSYGLAYTYGELLFSIYIWRRVILWLLRSDKQIHLIPPPAPPPPPPVGFRVQCGVGLGS